MKFLKNIFQDKKFKSCWEDKMLTRRDVQKAGHWEGGILKMARCQEVGMLRREKGRISKTKKYKLKISHEIHFVCLLTQDTIVPSVTMTMKTWGSSNPIWFLIDFENIPKIGKSLKTKCIIFQWYVFAWRQQHFGFVENVLTDRLGGKEAWLPTHFS